MMTARAMIEALSRVPPDALVLMGPFNFGIDTFEAYPIEVSESPVTVYRPLDASRPFIGHQLAGHVQSQITLDRLDRVANLADAVTAVLIGHSKEDLWPGGAHGE